MVLLVLRHYSAERALRSPIDTSDLDVFFLHHQWCLIQHYHILSAVLHTRYLSESLCRCKLLLLLLGFLLLFGHRLVNRLLLLLPLGVCTGLDHTALCACLLPWLGWSAVSVALYTFGRALLRQLLVDLNCGGRLATLVLAFKLLRHLIVQFADFGLATERMVNLSIF